MTKISELENWIQSRIAHHETVVLPRFTRMLRDDAFDVVRMRGNLLSSTADWHIARSAQALLEMHPERFSEQDRLESIQNHFKSSLATASRAIPLAGTDIEVNAAIVRGLQSRLDVLHV